MTSKLALILITTSLLSGCGIFMKPEPIVVNKVELVHIKVPDFLLTKCQAQRPISPSDYILLDPIERETYLTDYAVMLLGTIKDCNDKLDGVKRLQPNR